MATYKVPQFIEVEDKIFGPFTFKQFVYLVGGGAACFVIWHFLPSFIAILLIIPIGAFAGALAFYKVNNRPFIVLVESYVKYVLNGRLYLWHKEPPKPTATTTPKIVHASTQIVPTVSGGKLKELSWNLDVNENINQ